MFVDVSIKSLKDIFTFRYTCKFVCTFKIKSLTWLNNIFYLLCYTQTITYHNIVKITGEIIKKKIF